jgi:hypothetical protein
MWRLSIAIAVALLLGSATGATAQECPEECVFCYNVNLSGDWFHEHEQDLGDP